MGVPGVTFGGRGGGVKSTGIIGIEGRFNSSNLKLGGLAAVVGSVVVVGGDVVVVIVVVCLEISNC